MQAGGSEVSDYGDLSDPSPGDDQLLAEVEAASINPVDWKIRNGGLKFITGSKFPRIYGADFAGMVRETGKGVDGFKPGDRIYGSRSVLFDRHGVK